MDKNEFLNKIRRSAEAVQATKPTAQEPSQPPKTERINIQQEMIRNGEALKSEIMKMAKRGESAGDIFVKAVECIGEMTGDPRYAEDIKATYIAVHGHALGEKAPLELDLKEHERRLCKMREYIAKADDAEKSERTKRAIKAHEEMIARLKSMLGTV